jgi:hypothetical protein
MIQQQYHWCGVMAANCFILDSDFQTFGYWLGPLQKWLGLLVLMGQLQKVTCYPSKNMLGAPITESSANIVPCTYWYEKYLNISRASVGA